MFSPKLLKWAVIVVIVIVALTYGAYALVYKGNYNATVSFQIAYDSTGVFGISEVSVDSESTDAMQFWSELKGRSGPSENPYVVWMDLNISTSSVSEFESFDIAAGQTVSITHTFENIDPGQYTLRMYVKYALGNSILYSKTVSIMVGG